MADYLQQKEGNNEVAEVFQQLDRFKGELYVIVDVLITEPEEVVRKGDPLASGGSETYIAEEGGISVMGIFEYGTNRGFTYQNGDLVIRGDYTFGGGLQLRKQIVVRPTDTGTLIWTAERDGSLFPSSYNTGYNRALFLGAGLVTEMMGITAPEVHTLNDLWKYGAREAGRSDEEIEAFTEEELCNAARRSTVRAVGTFRDNAQNMLEELVSQQ